MEQDETGVARSQHVVHVLPPGDARVAGVLGPQVQRADAAVEGVQVLVLTPSAETAAWIARLVNPTVDGDHVLLVPVTAPARAARRLSAGARAVAGTPTDALALVRGSALKLEAVTTLVLVDGIELLATAGDDVATLLSELPKEAERILVTSAVDDAVSAFVEAHMRRARRITHDPLPTVGGSLQYLVTARGDRASALRRILDTFDPARATVLVEEAFVPAATRALASIGYAGDDALVRVRSGNVDAHEPLVICFGAPTSGDQLQAVVQTTPKATVVLVAPDELAAFLRLAGGRSTPLALSATPMAARAAEEALRDELRAMMRARALHREVLTIEPLLAEHDAVEVAAAALRMLELERDKLKAKRPAKSVEAPPAVAAPTERVAPAGTSYTRLFINVGERDGARKGDFVGAITGEAGVDADKIGNIELRDTFTIAEVASELAEKVIAALNGSAIRGRKVMAREDRGPTDRDGGERESRGSFRGGERSDRSGERGGDRGGFRGPPRGGDRGGDRGGFRGGERSGGGFRGGDRDRGGDRGPRSGGGFRGGERSGGGFRGGERSGGGFRGGERSGGGFRGGERSGGGFRGGERSGGGFRGGPPRRDREETGGGPRAINESREWSERGDRLRHARGRRTED